MDNNINNGINNNINNNMNNNINNTMKSNIGNMDKKENSKKIGIKFAITMICSLFAGIITGILAAKYGKKSISVVDISNTLIIPVTVLFCLISVGLFIASYVIYVRSQKEFRNWDGKDEDLLSKIEEKLSYPLLFSGIAQAVAYGFFPTIMWMGDQADIDKMLLSAADFVSAVMFILTFVWVLTLQHYIVKFLKLVNPEKKGSIFETDFNKKWLNSCDEAQKMQVYRAGFVAYNAGIKCCVALWLLSLVGMTALDTGVLPVIMTSIFLLVLTVSYCVECIKQGC